MITRIFNALIGGGVLLLLLPFALVGFVVRGIRFGFLYGQGCFDAMIKEFSENSEVEK